MTRLLLAPPRAMASLFQSLSLAGRIGLVVTVFWLLISLIGPWIAPHGMDDLTDADMYGGLTLAYPLGTDYLGRDMLSRVLYGAQYTIGLALTAAVIASIGGTLLALLAVTIGRAFDEVVSRIADVLLVTPSKIFALLMIAVFGSSFPVLILTVAVTYMPGSFRIARAMAVSLNTMEYVLVARLRGERATYIAWTEILPNMIHPMLADFGLRFVYIVLTLSGLSFLGLGVQPPYADWGALVRENMQGLFEGAPALIIPAVAIASLTIGVNLFIDSLPARKRLPRAGATS